MNLALFGALVVGMLGTVPAAADTVPAATAASCSVDAAAASPTVVTGVEPVEVTTHCTATQSCYDGTTIQCQDEGGSCHSGPGSDNCGGWVQCGSDPQKNCPIVIEEGWSERIGCCGSKQRWRHYSYRCGVLESSESCAEACIPF